MKILFVRSELTLQFITYRKSLASQMPQASLCVTLANFITARAKWSLGRQRNVQFGCLRSGKYESLVSSSGVGHGVAKWTAGWLNVWLLTMSCWTRGGADG